jgi:hypothetical protein
VTPDSTSLRIGHGMCSGEFDFEDGGEYEISFSLIDASGNRNDTLTKAIKFISPTDKDTGNNEEKIYCECPKRDEEKKSNISVFIIVAITILSLTGLLIYGRRKKGSH